MSRRGSYDMSYIYYNANPDGKKVRDCVFRALATVFHTTWDAIAGDLSMMQIRHHDLQNSDVVWGEYLYLNGFRRGVLPSPCPNCVTIKEFCKLFPVGTFVVATGYHVVAVIDGNYYDTEDTGDEVLLYYWKKEY